MGQLPSANNLCSHFQLATQTVRWCGHIQVYNLIQFCVFFMYSTADLPHLLHSDQKANMGVWFVLFLVNHVQTSEQEVGNVLHLRINSGHQARPQKETIPLSVHVRPDSKVYQLIDLCKALIPICELGIMEIIPTQQAPNFEP